MALAARSACGLPSGAVTLKEIGSAMLSNRAAFAALGLPASLPLPGVAISPRARIPGRHRPWRRLPIRHLGRRSPRRKPKRWLATPLRARSQIPAPVGELIGPATPSNVADGEANAASNASRGPGAGAQHAAAGLGAVVAEQHRIERANRGTANNASLSRRGARGTSG